MLLKRLSILNYKNIEQADLRLSAKLNCFVGQNGMGKTNLLDAVYYLSFCKSACNPIDSQNILHDADFLMIQGYYETDGGDAEEVYCGLKRRQKKQFKRNKKEYRRLSDHIGMIPLVMISPDDQALILGGSDERRRFIDVVISQYDKNYLNTLIRYNKALEQRNVLLKAQQPIEDGVLDVLEEMMAQMGQVVYEKRKAFVEEFIPIFEKYYQTVSQGKETVSLAYESHASRGDLLDIIRQIREKDLILGYSLHGIHKDELTMMLDGYPLKREGSQGQSKTYLVALKLAQFEFLKRIGTTPLLLLDDIFDKLDANRVQQLVKLVGSDSFGQIFITDTNRGRMDHIMHEAQVDYSLFYVENGVVTTLEEAGNNEAE